MENCSLGELMGAAAGDALTGSSTTQMAQKRVKSASLTLQGAPLAPFPGCRQAMKLRSILSPVREAFISTQVV